MDQQAPRTSSPREDQESEDLRVKRAEDVARVAYHRANRTFIVAFVSLVLSIASTVYHYL